MLEDTLIRIEGKLDALVADVAILKTDVAVLKTDVAGLTDRVTELETSGREMRASMDVMAEEIHNLYLLHEDTHSLVKMPLEGLVGLREHMDKQFVETRREFREAIAPLTLVITAHTAMLNARPA